MRKLLICDSPFKLITHSSKTFYKVNGTKRIKIRKRLQLNQQPQRLLQRRPQRPLQRLLQRRPLLQLLQQQQQQQRRQHNVHFNLDGH